MTKIEFKKASEPLSKYAQRARKDLVIVVKKGKPFFKGARAQRSTSNWLIHLFNTNTSPLRLTLVVYIHN